MALKVLEQQLKKQKFSLRTDMGTWKSNAYDVMKDMMPREYKGKINVPEDFKKDGGNTLIKLNECIDMFLPNKLHVDVDFENGKSYFEITLHERCMQTVNRAYLGSVVIVKTDTLEDAAIYLRRYWQLPLSFEYAPIPDSIEKINKWLHDFGGDNLKVYVGEEKYGGYFKCADTENNNKELLIGRYFGKDPREYAICIAQHIPNITKIWSYQEEKRIEDNQKADRLIYETYADFSKLDSMDRGCFILGRTPICRVLAHNENIYTLQDTAYNTKTVTKDALKQAMKQGKINVLGLQITKDGRLVKKTVNLKSVCTPYKGMNGDWDLPEMTVEHQHVILFCGLAYINSNMSPELKREICEKIAARDSMDSQDLISIYTHNDQWSNDYYWKLDTQCRDRIIDMIYTLNKMKSGHVKINFM